MAGDSISNALARNGCDSKLRMRCNYGAEKEHQNCEG